MTGRTTKASIAESFSAVEDVSRGERAAPTYRVWGFNDHVQHAHTHST